MSDKGPELSDKAEVSDKGPELSDKAAQIKLHLTKKRALFSNLSGGKNPQDTLSLVFVN